MASIERTAYPRFSRPLTVVELQCLFSPTPEELDWAQNGNRRAAQNLALIVQLKCFQYLHHFLPVDRIPREIVEHICGCMGLRPQSSITYPARHRSLYRHQEAIRKHLGVKPFLRARAHATAGRIAREASSIVNTRNDVINILISELIRVGYELPSFSTLLKVAEKEHEAAERALYEAIDKRLKPEQRRWLDELLVRELAARQTRYNELKRSARKTSRQHLDQRLEQLAWLVSLPDSDALLEGVPASRLKHLSDRAAVLDASEMAGLAGAKRYTLTLALIRQMRTRTRDDIAEMFIRRMGACHNSAREELESIQSHQRELSEGLVAKLEQVLELLAQGLDDAELGRRVRKLLAPHGSLEQLQADCEVIQIWSGNNYLPLMRKPFNSWRAQLFRMARALRFSSTSQDRHLIDALQVVLDNEHRKSEWIADEVNLSFASERWYKLIRRPHSQGAPTNRRYLEVCVFSHLSKELRSGDVCIEGSDTYGDDRKQLLPWSECEKRLKGFCERAGLEPTAQGLCDALKKQLTDTAAEVDREFPDHTADVTINSSGEPTVKRTNAREVPASALALQATIDGRVKPRNLLDVLVNIDHWTGFTRHFGPLSGEDAKMRNARAQYLLTTFALGTGLGVTQAARHLANQVSAHQLSYANRRHMSLEQLDAAHREMAELYLRLPLPLKWGDGSSVAADGTQYDFYDQNLLVGMHFRYKKKGAVAYRHVADNYIAVFHHFMPPGMLEALYVIEGLQKAGLSVEADTVYSDTHGQSETVFAFTYLSGIQLMPRIRGWKDLKFYRPAPDTKYWHIDPIFAGVLDWQLILNHWKDLMQIAISIQAGCIASPMLLRKLSNESRYNRVFAAARELGRVLRTIYLLRWINSKEMRQEITAETNKIESYHAFTKWLHFGGDVINENDPIEQQKRLRYIDLVASAVILQNVVDMMQAIEELHMEGYPFNEDDLCFMSPYGRNTKRFGSFHLDLKKPPEPWLRTETFKDLAKQARVAIDRAKAGSKSRTSKTTARRKK